MHAVVHHIITPYANNACVTSTAILTPSILEPQTFSSTSCKLYINAKIMKGFFLNWKYKVNPNNF